MESPQKVSFHNICFYCPNSYLVKLVIEIEENSIETFLVFFKQCVKGGVLCIRLSIPSFQIAKILKPTALFHSLSDVEDSEDENGSLFEVEQSPSPYSCD